MANNLQRMFRRFRYGEPIVVVSGLPRSGTSMAMRMLEATGLTIVVDGIREADEDNPKGYFELERVKDLAQENDWEWLQEARGKAIKIISYLLKELPDDHNYKVLFMRRDLREVLASQAKMLERRGESNDSDDERMIELYENDLWKARLPAEEQRPFRHSHDRLSRGARQSPGAGAEDQRIHGRRARCREDGGGRRPEALPQPGRAARHLTSRTGGSDGCRPSRAPVDGQRDPETGLRAGPRDLSYDAPPGPRPCSSHGSRRRTT